MRWGPLRLFGGGDTPPGRKFAPFALFSDAPAMRRLCACVWFAAWLASTTSAVEINRCCSTDHVLGDDWKCLPGETGPWAPPVYSPTKASFLTPGTVPDDWEFAVRTPACPKPLFLPLKNNPPPFVLIPSGELLMSNNIEEPKSRESYCLDPRGALVCPPDAQPADTGERIALRKCCGLGGAWSERNASCVVALSDQTEFSDDVAWLHKFPHCSEGVDFSILGKLNSTYWLLDNGTLLDDRTSKTLPEREFCLEKIFEYPEDPVHVFGCTSNNPTKVPHDIRFTIYPIGMFLSVFFLAITLIASCLLPSTYHVLHWRCQTNHVACLLVGDLLLAITQLSGDALQAAPKGCVSIAIAMHFIFLAAFFWLNTMCFNIWWTFRDLRPASLDKGQEACRLRIYELYAWGGPLVISGIGAILDNFPQDPRDPHDFIRPRFGENRCFFYGDLEMLYYFYGPIGVLLIMNLTLFAATARELTCGLWKTEVVKSNTERATLGRVCLKLVVVMGITWVVDVVSWVVGGPDYVWYLTDIINSLQGVLIFAVIGCQPQVWAAVKRLWCLKNSANDTNNARSSSSHALPSLNDHNTSVTNTSKAAETLC